MESTTAMTFALVRLGRTDWGWTDCIANVGRWDPLAFR